MEQECLLSRFFTAIEAGCDSVNATTGLVAPAIGYVSDQSTSSIEPLERPINFRLLAAGLLGVNRPIARGPYNFKSYVTRRDFSLFSFKDVICYIFEDDIL